MSIHSQISFNKQKTWLIFAVFIALFTGLAYFIGLFFDSANGFLIGGLLMSLVSSVGSYFYADKIVLATSGAQPATRAQHFDLYTVTENLSMAAGLPMPKLYVIQDPAPNAFATGRDPKHAVVAATTGLLEKLDRRELEGVIAHELSHVKNYDILVATIVAALAGTVTIATDWIMHSLWWGGGDDEDRAKNPLMFALVIVVLILSPIIATLIQLAISRRREFLADASGALLTRYPAGLARALQKIADYNKPMQNMSSNTAHLFISNPMGGKKSAGSFIAGLFSTHPPIEERIKILEAM